MTCDRTSYATPNAWRGVGPRKGGMPADVCPDPAVSLQHPPETPVWKMDQQESSVRSWRNDSISVGSWERCGSDALYTKCTVRFYFSFVVRGFKLSCIFPFCAPVLFIFPWRFAVPMGCKMVFSVRLLFQHASVTRFGIILGD